MTATERTQTAAQARIVELFTEAGWTVKKTEFIGAKLWIVAEKLWKGTGNVFLDKSMFGTIGPRGALNLEYMQFDIKDKVTEPYQLRSRLARDSYDRDTAERDAEDAFRDANQD